MAGRSYGKFTAALLFFLIVSVVMPAMTISHTLNSNVYDTVSDSEVAPPEGSVQPVLPPDPVITPAPATDPVVPDDPGAYEDAGDSGDIDTSATAPVLPPFEPYAVDSTAPERMLASAAIMADGRLVDSYSAAEPIDFGFGDAYTELEGITTFRGNNFRDAPSYGFADIVNAKFGDKWSRATGSLTAPDGAYWSGHGWSGQPLIVKWPKQTRGIMNMHDWAKQKDELVEVIYPAMDGYIYFSELETGTPTRDKLFLGFTIKGTGAIDPRGYPLLYVGAGYGSAKGVARIFIISLVDGSVLHTFGNNDSFAHRSWSAADSSPLISAETDTLIYPSENGVIYLIKLNSVFDPDEGLISIDPSAPVKWRYKGKRNGSKYWMGIESSPAIWRGCLMIADNGGHLICLDLNTLKPVWVQDVLDDTNNSPVLELEDGYPFIYISTGFHGGWRAATDARADVPIWKIDAVTGEIIWRTDYSCYTVDGVSGGVQGTIALGKNELCDLIFVQVARTPARGAGILTALDKNSGGIVWEFKPGHYGWSSPVCVYDSNGKGYIVFCSSEGNMYLLDGLTGELMDSVRLGGVIEASPAVYNSTVVIGTRAMKIWGITIT